MNALETEPLFTLKRAWDPNHTHTYKKYEKNHQNGQYNEEEVAHDEGKLGLEFSVDVDMGSFLNAQKIL